MEFSKEVNLQKLLSSKKDKKGPIIHFDPIDQKIGGLQRNLVILGGFSGCYKTTFALNIAYNNVVKLNYPVAFSSLEMDPSDLWLRLVLRHAQNPKFRKYGMDISVPNSMWHSPQFMPDDKIEYFLEIVGKDLLLNYEPIIMLSMQDFIDHQFNFDMMLNKAIENYGGYLRNQRIDLFIVDYIQLLANTMRYGFRLLKTDKYQFVGDVIRDLRRLTQVYNNGQGINVIALSQLNREGFKEAKIRKGKYDLTSIAESAEIVNAADIVITLYADDTDKKGKQCRVQLLKNRFGETIDEPTSMLTIPEKAYIGNFPQSSFEEVNDMVNSLLGVNFQPPIFDFRLDIKPKDSYMQNCGKCGGKGFLLNEDDVLIFCSCMENDKKMSYILPLRRLCFVTPNAGNVKPIKLEDISQAIVKTYDNMAGLITFVMSSWYPKEYRVITLDETNAIGMGRHPEFNSIYDCIKNCTNVILDCSMNSKNRHESVRQLDSQYATVLITGILSKERGKIIIVLPTEIKAFTKDYQDLCESLDTCNIQCFRNGKYQTFSMQKKEAGDGQSISN